MSIGDFIILFLLAVSVFLVVRSIYRRKKTGSFGCCGSCSGCTQTCAAAEKRETSLPSETPKKSNFQ